MISQTAGLITGLVTGTITGILAIPRPFYTLLQHAYKLLQNINNEAQNWSLFEKILCIVGTPLATAFGAGFLLMLSPFALFVTMARGIAAGVSEGFLAALTFPWTHSNDVQKKMEKDLINRFLPLDTPPTQAARINPPPLPATNPPLPPPAKVIPFSGRAYQLVDSNDSEPLVQPDISQTYGSNPLLTQKIHFAKIKADTIQPKLKLLEQKEISRLYSVTQNIYKSYANSRCEFSNKPIGKLKDPITVEWTHHNGIPMFATVSCSELQKRASSSLSDINIKGKNLRDKDVNCYLGFVNKEAFEPIPPPPHPIGTLTF